MHFLLYFWGGASMKVAAAAAGYQGSTPQALCNTGRAILTKFSNNPKALFRVAGEQERNIARLISDTMDDDSKFERRLKTLKILADPFSRKTLTFQHRSNSDGWVY